MHKVVPDELHVNFVCERAPISHVAAHVAEGPRVDGVHLPCQVSGALPPLRTEGAEVEGNFVLLWLSTSSSSSRPT